MIIPTNTSFNGCRIWLECDTISTANKLEYYAGIGQRPLVVHGGQPKADPIERDRDGKEDGTTGEDVGSKTSIRPVVSNKQSETRRANTRSRGQGKRT